MMILLAQVCSAWALCGYKGFWVTRVSSGGPGARVLANLRGAWLGPAGCRDPGAQSRTNSSWVLWTVLNSSVVPAFLGKFGITQKGNQMPRTMSFVVCTFDSNDHMALCWCPCANSHSVQEKFKAENLVNRTIVKLHKPPLCWHYLPIHVNGAKTEMGNFNHVTQQQF